MLEALVWAVSGDSVVIPEVRNPSSGKTNFGRGREDDLRCPLLPRSTLFLFSLSSFIFPHPTAICVNTPDIGLLLPLPLVLSDAFPLPAFPAVEVDSVGLSVNPAELVAEDGAESCE